MTVEDKRVISAWRCSVSTCDAAPRIAFRQEALAYNDAEARAAPHAADNTRPMKDRKHRWQWERWFLGI